MQTNRLQCYLVYSSDCSGCIYDLSRSWVWCIIVCHTSFCTILIIISVHDIYVNSHKVKATAHFYHHSSLFLHIIFGKGTNDKTLLVTRIAEKL